MHLTRLLLITCISLACVDTGCRSKPEARTPQEFIEMYSKAWQDEDADAIMELRVPQSPVNPGTESAARITLDDSLKSAERDAIVQSIKRHDFTYTAWSRTTFEGARDHGDHVHVDVRIDAARSEVVLVRNEGLLRIHPNPSQFQ